MANNVARACGIAVGVVGVFLSLIEIFELF